jgi:hypothetical protein
MWGVWLVSCPCIASYGYVSMWDDLVWAYPCGGDFLAWWGGGGGGGVSRVGRWPRVGGVTHTEDISWAASVRLGRWYGFTSREAAQAWLGDREGVVCPACLADDVVAWCDRAGRS